tara:strand:+ start:1549 stop:1995 length:447 start_codon:yes stop_codon:yes gene_type:complete
LSNLDYIIYTDGACLGNPGPGGWAAIIFDNNNKKISQNVGAEITTTNNRMELVAIIESLKKIPSNSSLSVFTDSKYVINGIETWIVKWKKNDWVGSNKKKVKNKDLWIELDQLSNNFEIKWNWVRGHSGNKYNEEVDKLARNEALKLN